MSRHQHSKLTKGERNLEREPLNGTFPGALRYSLRCPFCGGASMLLQILHFETLPSYGHVNHAALAVAAAIVAMIFTLWIVVLA
jgi:hypothetical protein